MGTFTVDLPDEIYKQLEKIEDKIDEIIPKVLVEGGKIALNAAKANLSRVISSNPKSKSTGELINSLGLSAPNRWGNDTFDIKVGFREPRKHQPKGGKYSKYEKTNAMVANIIEYGRSTTRGGVKVQAPRPFMRPAAVSSKKACIGAMKTKFDEEVSKLK